MNRQNTTGWYPSLRRLPTMRTALTSLRSLAPRSWSARSAKRRSCRDTVSPLTAPGITSTASSVSSRSSSVRRPISSTRATVSASAVTARVRIVAAAAAGLDAMVRSNPSADHQRIPMSMLGLVGAGTNRLAGVGQHVVEQAPVFAGQHVGVFSVAPLGEAGFGIQVSGYVVPSSLYQVAGEPVTMTPGYGRR